MNKINPSEHTYTITELNQAARLLLEQTFASVWVEGEMSNLSRPASGHLYFSLKDNDAQIACALFKGSRFGLKIPLRDLDNGMAVRAHGRISLYEARGSYQLIIDQIEPVGRGDLERALATLQAQLTIEGHFDHTRKRPIPEHPRQIGIITSPSGAAIHDALTTLARRNPTIPIIVYPSAVQGENAAKELIAQIHTANHRAECDTLLLIRGGGSLEDLWSFNHPDLIRTVTQSRIPIISGVGHETDITLVDLAADLRAPTPTAAAELSCPPVHVLQAQLQQYQRRLNSRLQQQLQYSHQHLSHLKQRLTVQYPERRLQQCVQQLDDLRERLQRNIQQNLYHTRTRLEHLMRSLHSLSPLATLTRGYAIVHNSAGEVIRDAQHTQPKEDLHIQLANGKLICTVRQRRQNRSIHIE